LLEALSVRGLFCPIAADRHAAPPSRTAPSSIDEEERALGTLARLYVGEVFGADKIGQRSGQG
jgi:hypothetical protein